jgi:hypothetical protein
MAASLGLRLGDTCPTRVEPDFYRIVRMAHSEVLPQSAAGITFAQPLAIVIHERPSIRQTRTNRRD